MERAGLESGQIERIFREGAISCISCCLHRDFGAYLSMFWRGISRCLSGSRLVTNQ